MTLPRSPSFVLLVALTMGNPLALNMFLPGLTEMADEFGVTYARMSVSVGGYLAMTAVLALVIGPLSDRIGRRPVTLGVAAIFTLASLVGALAQDFTLFMAARVAQAVVVGGFILASSIVRDTRSEDEIAPQLSHIASAMAIAPLVAPLLGGFVVDAFGWRAVFWIYVLLGIALVIAILITLPETRTASTASLADAARVLLVLPHFWTLVGVIACSVGGFFAFLAGTPLIASAVYGLSSQVLGFALSSITIGFFFGTLISARVTPRFGAMPVALFGRVVTVFGLGAGLPTTYLFPTEPLALFLATIFIGIGNGFTIPNINARILSLRPEFAGTAMGIASSAIVGTGAIVTTLGGYVVGQFPTATAFAVFLFAVSVLGLVLILLARSQSKNMP